MPWGVKWYGSCNASRSWLFTLLRPYVWYSCIWITSKFVYIHFYLLKSYNIHCYGHDYLYIQCITDMRRLTKAIHSEKCVVSRLRRRANVIECKKVKVKWSRYRSGVAQRVGRGIALLFHDGGTRRGWVVRSKTRPHLTPGKDTEPILQEAGWAPGPVWTGGISRPHRASIPDRPAGSQSLYRLSYPAS